MSDDRIKLAEAMGCVVETHSGQYGVLYGVRNKNGVLELLPDPFTDANDDYAVLEWMRNTCPGGCFDDGYGDERPLWVAILAQVMEADDCENCLDYGVYKIGDYARAALKVLT